VNVRVVLDTSALLAYSRLEGVAVGELIAMVEEDGVGNLVGVPAASFLAAYRALDAAERHRLVRMATEIDGVTAVLPLMGGDVVNIADLATRVGDEADPHAIYEAGMRDALLATYCGATARKELPPDIGRQRAERSEVRGQAAGIGWHLLLDL
jgi:hypothetical protein